MMLFEIQLFVKEYNYYNHDFYFIHKIFEWL